MDIVELDDVPVSAEGLTNKLHLFILLLDLINQISPLTLHSFEKLIEEFPLVVDPSGLVFYVANVVSIEVLDQKDIFYSSLSFELMHRIVWIIAYFTNEKSLFSQYFLLASELVDDLDSNLVLRLDNIKREYLLPLRIHIIWLSNNFGMLNLFHIIDNDLYHWLELISIKKLIIKLSIYNIQCQS